MKPEYVVSGCLAGLNCRFDGASSPCSEVIELVRSGRAVVVCPESLAGLAAPRPPCELKNGRVISRDGLDRTCEFQAGAETALAEALASGAKKAILKARSPSCGINHIYNGEFNKTLVPGTGVFAKLLYAAGFEIWDEDALPPDLASEQRVQLLCHLRAK